ncbi:MAG: hypothetical protein Q8L23_02925 [Caulobacter sp.]|nr:hypothetical protein [Caulobacter sp.]
MAQIDIAKTAFAGFGLIARKPMAVAGWALFLLVVGILPVALMIGPFMTTLFEFIDLAKADIEPSKEQLASFMSAMYMAHPVLWLTGLITRVMLTGAVFRAILEPSAGRWAYLRLGMGEVMLAVVVIVLGILIGLAAMVFMGVSAGITVAIWQASEAAAIGVGILLGVALVFGVIWALLRFSLAAPMSFAERNFRLFESWSLTKGHAFNLLIVAILVAVVLALLEAVVVTVFVVVVGSAAGVGVSSGALTEETVRAFFDQPAATWMPLVAPWLALVGVVASVLGAMALAIVTAPWAEAYRQLNKGPEPGM